MQLVELENNSDFLDAVGRYVRKICSEKDKFRMINDQNKRAIAILLREDGSVEVRTYDKKFTIRNGELEPLRKDLAPYITAQFTINGELVTGQLLRGYVYQKLLELKNEPLKEHPRLFFPIKRLAKAESALENVFISDKLLTLLIRDLHHAVSALNPLSEVTETCQKITPIKLPVNQQIKEFASTN